MKALSVETRDATEEHPAWVRDPAGGIVRVHRYVIRRYEHDGVRYFIGVTPKGLGGGGAAAAQGDERSAEGQGQPPEGEADGEEVAND
ncbi:hypothetical protein STCU_11386 [Strigomonas culicis]|uniref:Uncharacterized protein n=1 Tax=Strigomonas culicis TaxID=28005 RepID=S9TE55_9TRYP|nr:hypothetical protein STCU_11386 [Strigomonas culicis]|eukprot:EPY16337.1 hypothetical protein STCU_11386 [Strigomonas culicis]